MASSSSHMSGVDENEKMNNAFMLFYQREGWGGGDVTISNDVCDEGEDDLEEKEEKEEECDDDYVCVEKEKGRKEREEDDDDHTAISSSSPLHSLSLLHHIISSHLHLFSSPSYPPHLLSLSLPLLFDGITRRRRGGGDEVMGGGGGGDEVVDERVVLTSVLHILIDIIPLLSFPLPPPSSPSSSYISTPLSLPLILKIWSVVIHKITTMRSKEEEDDDASDDDDVITWMSSLLLSHPWLQRICGGGHIHSPFFPSFSNLLLLLVTSSSSSSCGGGGRGRGRGRGSDIISPHILGIISSSSNCEEMKPDYQAQNEEEGREGEGREGGDGGDGGDGDGDGDVITPHKMSPLEAGVMLLNEMMSITFGRVDGGGGGGGAGHHITTHSSSSSSPPPSSSSHHTNPYEVMEEEVCGMELGDQTTLLTIHHLLTQPPSSSSSSSSSSSYSPSPRLLHLLLSTLHLPHRLLNGFLRWTTKRGGAVMMMTSSPVMTSQQPSYPHLTLSLSILLKLCQLVFHFNKSQYDDGKEEEGEDGDDEDDVKEDEEEGEEGEGDLVWRLQLQEDEVGWRDDLLAIICNPVFLGFINIITITSHHITSHLMLCYLSHDSEMIPVSPFTTSSISSILQYLVIHHRFNSHTSHPHLIHIPSTSHPHLIHIPSTSHQHLIHISSTSHPHPIHISSTSHPHLIHISSTSHPHHIHISSTSHPHPIHISSTSHPHLILIPSTSHALAC